MLARIRPGMMSSAAQRLRMFGMRQFSAATVRRSDAIFVHRDTPENNPSIPFEFSSTNLSEAQKIMAKYPPQYKKAAMIPLLHLAQKQNGWTSLSVMNYIAKLLEVHPMRVYEVATFYTMFNRNPVGKYFLQVCTTTPCELCGASKIVSRSAALLRISCSLLLRSSVPAPVSMRLWSPQVRKVKRGPLNGRINCEPLGGQTTLTTPPPGPGFMVREDL
ncbi:hypothetical protein DL89DRAFT_265289 [Linderina pennispora]|uniref:Uncharacterized protein n=1 Tax=Linderina pennispora TaxID=61395 RepID=A0A1Y1WJ79_9FUNG|nr:uncharacterized protein DL89DRAFT_265289 [Linderina pennispora]ORX73154.1 hypothetical protein DL89DRAFT_265289 [Linderina pennispora]